MKVKTCTWDWDLLQDKATSGLKTSYWRKEFHTFLSTSNRAEDKFLLLPSSKKNGNQISMVVKGMPQLFFKVDPRKVR